MAKPEWGHKRTCQSCGARFYDLGRDPIVCPKCGHEHSAESFVKSRRTRAAPPPEEKQVAARKPADELLVAEGEDVELETEGEEEEEEIIEDASELAEDDTDVADVIGVDETEEDTER